MKRTKWCANPDKAFDRKCLDLGVEDSCMDKHVCPLASIRPVYITVNYNFHVKDIENSDVVIKISDDKKSFKVIKHRYLASTQEYNMSQLKNILLAGAK